MILTTISEIPGKKVVEILGLVKGNTVRTRWFGRDIAASLRNIIGGEVKSYTEMLNKARDESLDRMQSSAKKLKADAIIGIRMTTSDIMQGSAEMLAYGTAVKLK